MKLINESRNYKKNDAKVFNIDEALGINKSIKEDYEEVYEPFTIVKITKDRDNDKWVVIAKRNKNGEYLGYKEEDIKKGNLIGKLIKFTNKDIKWPITKEYLDKQEEGRYEKEAQPLIDKVKDLVGDINSIINKDAYGNDLKEDLDNRYKSIRFEERSNSNFVKRYNFKSNYNEDKLNKFIEDIKLGKKYVDDIKTEFDVEEVSKVSKMTKPTKVIKIILDSEDDLNESLKEETEFKDSEGTKFTIEKRPNGKYYYINHNSLFGPNGQFVGPYKDYEEAKKYMLKHNPTIDKNEDLKEDLDNCEFTFDDMWDAIEEGQTYEININNNPDEYVRFIVNRKTDDQISYSQYPDETWSDKQNKMDFLWWITANKSDKEIAEDLGIDYDEFIANKCKNESLKEAVKDKYIIREWPIAGTIREARRDFAEYNVKITRGKSSNQFDTINIIGSKEDLKRLAEDEDIENEIEPYNEFLKEDKEDILAKLEQDDFEIYTIDELDPFYDEDIIQRMKEEGSTILLHSGRMARNWYFKDLDSLKDYFSKGNKVHFGNAEQLLNIDNSNTNFPNLNAEEYQFIKRNFDTNYIENEKQISGSTFYSPEETYIQYLMNNLNLNVGKLSYNGYLYNKDSLILVGFAEGDFNIEVFNTITDFENEEKRFKEIYEVEEDLSEELDLKDTLLGKVLYVSDSFEDQNLAGKYIKITNDEYGNTITFFEVEDSLEEPEYNKMKTVDRDFIINGIEKDQIHEIDKQDAEAKFGTPYIKTESIFGELDDIEDTIESHSNKRYSVEDRNRMVKELATKLANEELQEDVTLYFDNKRYKIDSNGQLVFDIEADPKDYFDYARTPNILSMSFEGELYDMLNYNNMDYLDSFFNKYGLYYEFGDAWNLSVYPINDEEWEEFDNPSNTQVEENLKEEVKGSK